MMKKLAAKKFPSIASLQCFETSARHLSFTKAAQELHMTQSAVSKQVAQLEHSLNNALFNRLQHRLQLTPTGKLFLRQAQEILSSLEQSVLNILAHGSEAETLRIFTHPTFGARWLIPALKGFGKAHPHIHLDVHDALGDFCAEFNPNMDIGFLHGDGVWPGLTSIKLFDGHFVAVCAPHAAPAPLDDVANQPNSILIQSRVRPRAWQAYFQAQSQEWAGTFNGPRFDSFYAVIHAAECGCGIGLVPHILVQEELADGRLQLAWPHHEQQHGAYYLVHPTNMETTPKVRTLIEWIQARL